MTSRADAVEPAYSTPNREVVIRALEGFSSLAVVGDEHAFVVDEPNPRAQCRTHSPGRRGSSRL
jgi:hypothetical protein